MKTKKTTKTETRVAFRKDTFNGIITAVFIDEIFTDSRPWTRVCYEHLGQHGECALAWVVQDTRPAKPSEYKALLRELTELVGYNDLKILKDLRGLK